MNGRDNRVPARRLARRLEVFARLEERLDRRSPRAGGVSPEVMRIMDRVVMGDPEEMAANGPSESPSRTGRSAATITTAAEEVPFTGD